jgi:hypothetical protein
LPLWLCRRIINKDLVPFWQWLGQNPVEEDLAPARQVVPAMRSMQAWLQERRSPS